MVGSLTALLEKTDFRLAELTPLRAQFTPPSDGVERIQRGHSQGMPPEAGRYRRIVPDTVFYEFTT